GTRQDRIGQGPRQLRAALRLDPIIGCPGGQLVEGGVIGDEYRIRPGALQRQVEAGRFGQRGIFAVGFEAGGNGLVAGFLYRLGAVGGSFLAVLVLVATGKSDEARREAKRDHALVHWTSPNFSTDWPEAGGTEHPAPIPPGRGVYAIWLRRWPGRSMSPAASSGRRR